MTSLVVLKQKIRKYSLLRNRKINPPLDQFYFAYGANVRETRYQENQIPHDFFGAATVQGYEIKFNLPTNRLKLGYSSIYKNEGSSVWGTLVRLSMDSILLLDLLEWVNYDYYKRVKVSVYGAFDKPINAWAYEGLLQKEGLVPSTEYIQTMISVGKELGYQQDYLDFLKSIPNQPFNKFLPDLRFNISRPETPRSYPQLIKPLIQADFFVAKHLMRKLP